MSKKTKEPRLKYVETVEPYKLKTSQKFYCAVKTLIDFLIALIAIIVLSPLFLIVAIAIKIDSKGPVFFVQKRIGKNGKEFDCIKFRSMSIKANHDCPTYEYNGVESYITRVGKVIRKLSIDELPQLFNILNFKMYLISYRPVVPCETELHEARNELNVYQIKPGLTGWAQVNGRDVLAAHPTLKARYDAYYLHNISLLLDIKIFFLTIFKILKKSDIEEGVITETPAIAAEEAAFAEVAAADGSADLAPAEETPVFDEADKTVTAFDSSSDATTPKAV